LGAGTGRVKRGLRGRPFANVGLPLAGRRVESAGKIVVGSLTPLGGGVALPFSWQARRRRRLLPDVAAELIASPIGPELTQLSLSATYTPPLGQIGEVLDRTLMHRLAETVIRDFLNRVAAQIAERLSPAHRRDGG